jgi:hypothetical protein
MTVKHTRTGLTLLALATLALASPVGARSAAAEAATPSQSARTAIVAVIEAQLAAFQRDDAAAAFRYAAPGIRARFGTPGHFMRMVRMSYGPLYRAQGIRFLDLQQADGQLVQRVLVTGADLGTYLAHYPMQQLDDGQWRIAGCVLVLLGQGRGA